MKITIGVVVIVEVGDSDFRPNHLGFPLTRWSEWVRFRKFIVGGDGVHEQAEAFVKYFR